MSRRSPTTTANRSSTNSSSIRNAHTSHRPTKKQRREQPLTPLDHESLECVASPLGPITTTPLLTSSLDQELILERLEKEIVRPFQLTLSVPRGNKIVTASGTITNKNEAHKKKKKKKTVVRTKNQGAGAAVPLERRLLESRFAIGTNQCTHMLENTSQRQPVLVLLCRDVHPPTMLAHVPALLLLCRRETCNQQAPPVLVLLQGRASLELGKVLGIPRASIVVFTERPRTVDKDNVDEETKQEMDRYHDKIDSYIEFVKSKLCRP